MTILPPTGNPAPPDSLSELHMACMLDERAVGRVLARYRGGTGGNEELFTRMINAKTTDDGHTGGCTPLHYACVNGFTDAVRLLLQAGADPNIANNNGSTPIMNCVALAGHKGEIEACRSCIMQLLDHPRFSLELSDQACVVVICCVNCKYASRDVLLPLLQIFLTRGFNSSAISLNQSALSMALYHGHDKSAFALVRAGAYIYQTAPKSVDGDVWTALVACRVLYGDETARHLEQAASASAAVAGSRTRRKILLASAGNPNKMALKAFKTANILLTAGRHSKAASADTEAIEYPEDALSKQRRFKALTNLPTCLSREGRLEEALHYARQLCQEFSDNPFAVFTLGATIYQEATSRQTMDEVVECVEKAERLMLRSHGNGQRLMGITSLKEFRESLRRLKRAANQQHHFSPTVEVEHTAISEYKKVGGDIVKAARLVDEALRPELEHPDLPAMRALRGSIHFKWGKIIVSGKNTGLPILAGVSFQQPFLQAKEKFETALAEFEYCAAFLGDKVDVPRYIHDLNSGLLLIVLNSFNEGCARCLENLRKQLEEQLVNVDAVKEQEAGMLAEKHANISCEDLSDAAREAFTKLRADGAAAIANSVLSAQHQLASPSSRVLGTFLKEALQWDPHLVVPEKLKKAQSKVPVSLTCAACGISNPSNHCSCGNAHYCCKGCQVKAWKNHKKDCAFHIEQKAKK